MFNSAYVVDVIRDGHQIFDSGIIPTIKIAHTAFDLITHNEMPDLSLTGETTVRLIRDGEILRETTLSDSEILTEI